MSGLKLIPVIKKGPMIVVESIPTRAFILRLNLALNLKILQLHFYKRYPVNDYGTPYDG